MKPYALDANALYRFLMNGPGADTVEQLLAEARDAAEPLLMSAVNWGEVYYSIARAKGFDEADFIMTGVRLLPIAVLPADENAAAQAARLKAAYGLPYADCFAAATAARGAVLVTSDVKDFRRIPHLKLLALPGHKSRS